jgi:hypothetical protein
MLAEKWSELGGPRSDHLEAAQIEVEVGCEPDAEVQDDA